MFIMNLVSSSGIDVVKYSVELSNQIMGVGLLIRFGRNPSISVGQSRTPSKSIEYQPKLFLRWIFAENLLELQPKLLVFFQFLISRIFHSNRFESEQIFTASRLSSSMDDYRIIWMNDIVFFF
jgi:hypothetical protein